MSTWAKITTIFPELRYSHNLHYNEVRMIIILVIVLDRDPRSRFWDEDLCTGDLFKKVLPGETCEGVGASGQEKGRSRATCLFQAKHLKGEASAWFYKGALQWKLRCLPQGRWEEAGLVCLLFHHQSLRRSTPGPCTLPGTSAPIALG